MKYGFLVCRCHILHFLLIIQNKISKTCVLNKIILIIFLNICLLQLMQILLQIQNYPLVNMLRDPLILHTYPCSPNTQHHYKFNFTEPNNTTSCLHRYPNGQELSIKDCPYTLETCRTFPKQETTRFTNTQESIQRHSDHVSIRVFSGESSVSLGWANHSIQKKSAVLEDGRGPL